LLFINGKVSKIKEETQTFTYQSWKQIKKRHALSTNHVEGKRTKKGTTLTSNPLKESLKSNTMKYICKFRDEKCI